MVDNSPELNSKIDAAQQEENRWSEIIATYRDEYDENLISSFAFFERMVKGLTERYQVDNSTIDPAALEGLWKIFQATRKAVVEAYGFIKTEPETFREKITAAGMKTIDGLFHADMFSGKGSTLWHTLQGPRALVEGGLEDEYGIKTHVPYTGQSPDLTKEFIASGNGEKISKVLQPGFIEKSTGKVIREAVIETAQIS